jgi:hypothetical protein
VNLVQICGIEKARGFLKRRAEEDQESTHVGKKARGERSDQFEPDLSCDLSRYSKFLY